MDVVLRDGGGEPGFPTRLLTCRVRACESGCQRPRRFRIERRGRTRAGRARTGLAAGRSSLVLAGRQEPSCPEGDVSVKTWTSENGVDGALSSDDVPPGSRAQRVEAPGAGRYDPGFRVRYTRAASFISPVAVIAIFHSSFVFWHFPAYGSLLGYRLGTLPHIRSELFLEPHLMNLFPPWRWRRPGPPSL